MINWEQQFPFASINRADLTEFGCTDEQIRSVFTDDVMAEIAAKMQEAYYLTHPFWDDFKQAMSAFAPIPHERRSNGK
jgi:hypothetical protein